MCSDRCAGGNKGLMESLRCLPLPRRAHLVTMRVKDSSLGPFDQGVTILFKGPSWAFQLLDHSCRTCLLQCGRETVLAVHSYQSEYLQDVRATL